MSDSVQRYGQQPTRLLCPWDFPGKSTGVGCHLMLLGIIKSVMFVISHFGEGSGTPLQYFCLENPMDGGAW